jgi:iron complex outermembrane receptor protein
MTPEVIESTPMIVTAAKHRQEVDKTPVSVDVMPGSTIAARNPVTLDDALKQTAGVGIIDGQIDLRGSSGFNWSGSSRVLMLVDGHPMINGDTGGINWDVIPVEEIERVEIVKGAGSALYGSNAMAGMVNVLTRDPSRTQQTRIRLTGGVFDQPPYPEWRWTDRFLTYHLFDEKKFDVSNILGFSGIDISHSRRIGDLGVMVSLGRKTSTSYMENDDYSRWNALVKIKTLSSSTKTFDLIANWAVNDHGNFLQWFSKDRPLEVPDAELGNRILYRKGFIDATFRNAVSRSFAYSIKAHAYRTDWKDDFADNHDGAVTDRTGVELTTEHAWGAHAVTLGGEAAWTGTTSTMYGNHQVWDLAFYGEDVWTPLPRWQFSAGGRFDAHQVVGLASDREFSPRLGLVFQAWPGCSLRLSAGHGFRAPSLAEVFANTVVSGFRVLPNPNLTKAERAWSFEIGGRQVLDYTWDFVQAVDGFTLNPSLIHRIRNWIESGIRPILNSLKPTFVIDAAGFYSRYQNMIDVAIDPSSDIAAVKFMNLGGARIGGIETRISAVMLDGGLSASCGYTWLSTRDFETGLPLNYRSKHRLNLSVEGRSGRFTAGWDYRYASRIEEIVNLVGTAYDQRVPMHVMDVRIGANVSRYTVSLECDNVRNYLYTLRQREVEPIRSFVLTVKGTF